MEDTNQPEQDQPPPQMSDERRPPASTAAAPQSTGGRLARTERSARARPAGLHAGRAPGALPVLGHLPQLMTDPWAFLRRLPEHGDLVTVMIGPEPVHMLCDPLLLHHVLVDDRRFDKGGPLFDKAREVLGDGLATCPHAAHRRLRRLVQPAFHPSRMPGYAQMMGQQITEVTSTWHDGQVIDVHGQMHAIAAGVATTTMFSTRIDPRQVAATRRSVQIAMSGIYRRLLTPDGLQRLPLPANRSYDKARLLLHRTVEDLVARAMDQTDTDHGDLLSTLLAAGDRPDGLSRIEITEQVVTFFVSGVTSITSALAWTLHLLTRHPERAEQIYQEADQVLTGRSAAADDWPRLERTRRFVTETMRLYPPGWIFTRKVTEEAHLAGRTLPAGSTLAFSPYLLHHRPDLFPHPEQFDPDRFSPERTAHIPPHAYVPFGAGPRKCIGETFTLMQSTLALATIAARWRLHPIPGQRVRPAIRATLVPRKLHLRLETRL
ncbi:MULTISPECIES: cytochrome P450 [unclassified Streptomyces]|uniref:cytochrome P450 n=1 Tax=unclassified Streptomyces TaxID=2593676 RepID=UPI0033C54483